MLEKIRMVPERNVAGDVVMLRLDVHAEAIRSLDPKSRDCVAILVD
ncbi:hypothetical protein [Anaerohalosphaera lusitana]|nr:hypothetical protein [Anaerohalosphaera lusitana]